MPSSVPPSIPVSQFRYGSNLGSSVAHTAPSWRTLTTTGAPGRACAPGGGQELLPGAPKRLEEAAEATARAVAVEVALLPEAERLVLGRGLVAFEHVCGLLVLTVVRRGAAYSGSSQCRISVVTANPIRPAQYPARSGPRAASSVEDALACRRAGVPIIDRHLGVDALGEAQLLGAVAGLATGALAGESFELEHPGHATSVLVVGPALSAVTSLVALDVHHDDLCEKEV